MGPILLFILLALTGAFTFHARSPSDTVRVPICQPPAEGMDMAEVAARSASDRIIIRFRARVSQANTDRFLRLLDEAGKARPNYIVVELDTPGGIVEDGKRIVKAIEASPVPVHCLVIGDAASTGFYILQSCKTRTMYPGAHLLAHEIYQPWAEHIDRYAARKFLEELERDAKPFIDYEARRLRITRADFEAKTRERDWQMDAMEALVVGAVDGVVDPTSRQ